ncbi:LLM class flavin-dependent oxidoreductase [Microbacterium sp. YY-01]|uniref:LLM class flavin-dependent oxidoreductase n=1 Tax=Microbacterium sp. YY-01 TaxID=3421634 RepID=UPI003D17F3D5
MRFGLGVPTGTEGLMYPVPFADPEQAVRLAVEAERLGFDGVWGNDHVTTQRYVRAEFDEAPRFYDPYLYLSYVAASTTTLTLATAITVFAFRNPVVLAKQAATLDQLSGGRFILGVGIGAYREEAELMDTQRTLHRGKHAEEYLQALELLFTERRASYSGKYIAFDDIESYPKPRQSPLPILSGGNAIGSRERAAKYGHGWIPALLTPDEIREGIAHIARIATEHGRQLPDTFDIAPQFSVVPGKSTAAALDTFEQTQLFQHMRSLSKSTLKDQRNDDWAARNLVGTPAQMIDRIHAYAEAGVTTMSGLLFACNTVEETLDHMADFAENVMTPYRRETEGAHS